MEQTEEQMRRAIGTLLQSDPLIKLLQEVRLGRMKAADPGLRAVTESWMEVYAQVLEAQPVPPEFLPRLDPTPRLQVLVDAGVLSWDHAGTQRLRDVFQRLSAPVG